MFSVMTKSLVFSQGIDIKTYIWTWLCIVVDFFGIFFILTWVFYTDDNLFKPIFLDYFSIIGEVWFYKVMFSVSPCIVLGALGFIMRWYPEILKDIWESSRHGLTKKIIQTIFLSVAGTILILVMSFVGFIGIEIFCFSFVAILLYGFVTTRWRSYSSKNTGDKINGFIQFISKTSVFNRSNDRTLRIIAVNQGLYQKEGISALSHLYHYLKDIDQKDGLKGLKKITLADLRENCGPEYRRRWAKIYPDIMYQIKSNRPDCEDFKDGLCCNETYWDQKFEHFVYALGYWPIIIIAIPVFTICKIVQAVFPYIILGYLSYHNHLFKIDLFQLRIFKQNLFFFFFCPRIK